MKTMRSNRALPVLAVLAAGLLLATGCAEWNDNSAPGLKVTLSFAGSEPRTDGLIESPHESDPDTAEVKSIIVGAVVISRAKIPAGNSRTVFLPAWATAT